MTVSSNLPTPFSPPLPPMLSPLPSSQPPSLFCRRPLRRRCPRFRRRRRCRRSLLLRSRHHPHFSPGGWQAAVRHDSSFSSVHGSRGCHSTSRSSRCSSSGYSSTCAWLLAAGVLFGALQTVPDVALLPHHAAARSVVVPLSRAAAVCVIPPCHVSRFILADSRNRFQFELPLPRAGGGDEGGRRPSRRCLVRAESRAAVARPRVEEATAAAARPRAAAVRAAVVSGCG